MTQRELSDILNALDNQLKLIGARLCLSSIAVQHDKGETIFTAFNPHFKLCACKGCIETVALVKEHISATGTLGEPTNPEVV